MAPGGAAPWGGATCTTSGGKIVKQGHVSGVRRLGTFVRISGGPGIGKVGEVDGERVRVDYFESPTATIAQSQWVADHLVHRVLLEREERIWWRSPDGLWNAGRVIQAEPPRRSYIVRFPNVDYDLPVREEHLHVRWDRPVLDPAADLTVRGGSTTPYRDARLPVLKNLVRQRGACADMSTFLSSTVEIFPHQVNAALTVLSDPVQRYLLADEVGLGKTIEAGYVVRQILIDNPAACVVVVSPVALRRQWLSELKDKFHIGDFPDATIVVTSHETPEKWAGYKHADLVVVDEAHALVQAGPDETPYKELCALAHSAERLLLLSATPVTSGYLTNLGLLHLLDPELYSWERRQDFEDRYRMREQLANSVYSLNPQYTYVIRDSIDEIRAQVPSSDVRLAQLADEVLDMLDEDDEVSDPDQQDEFARRVTELRAHISETYRIHRRMIRNRREAVLQEASGPDAEALPYEVRGRQRPEALYSPSPVVEAGSEFVMLWWNSVREHLENEGLSNQLSKYAMPLAVLTSRAPALPYDAIDALRWRVRADADAGERAGLSLRERELLHGVPVVACEQTLLAEAEEDWPAGGEPSTENLKDIIRAFLPVMRKAQRTVVFCGPGRLAGALTGRLRSDFPKVVITEHTRSIGAAQAATDVARWADPTPGQAVLLVDDTAEDGLNLQAADCVVHLRLPWSPNQLEQRLGRVDRYPGPALPGAVGPALQFRLAEENGPDGSFTEAWAALLGDGYRVFDRSVSTLQDAIAQSVTSVWTGAVEVGPEGLVTQQEAVDARLGKERNEIRKMDLLESIHVSTQRLRSVPAALAEVELDWSETQKALLAYTDATGGGIKLRYLDRSIQGSPAWRFLINDGSTRPLLSPRHWKRVKDRLPDDEIAHAMFNRSRALRSRDARLFRVGNPLVDMLSDAVLNDSLGQSAAFRRIDRGMPPGQGPQPYFGFDFLIEADTSAALKHVNGSADAGRALRRQADRVFPPVIRRVWIESGTNRPVTTDAQLAFLNRPYDKSKGDRNYNSQRAAELFEVFGGQEHAAKYVRDAQQAALGLLHQHTDLTAVCQDAQHRALEVSAVLHSQAQARQAAGRLLRDTESLVTDAEVLTSLAEGLSRPVVRVVAAACLVRRGLELAY
ncbi:protein DpdE [Streptomyces albidoflavus]|uniref:protein DpdE n=1 Tax=Streptomyces albidoflavus TaxID=1886 RepID=UPI0009A101B2|nr:protein DpdE [Streptomyces albidoflavus]